MSTTTVRRPKEKETAQAPEWRRICHRYDGDSQVRSAARRDGSPAKTTGTTNARPAATASASSARDWEA